MSCCTVVGYSGHEPRCVIGALSIWVVMSPLGAAWLQGSDYEHMVAVRQDRIGAEPRILSMIGIDILTRTHSLPHALPPSLTHSVGPME